MKTYSVKSGDTLSGISKKFGITLQEILTVNPAITNPNQIKVGDLIKIPDNATNLNTTNTASIPSTAPLTSSCSPEALKKIVPKLSAAKADQLVVAINKAMQEAEINTSQRQAAFIAQIAHETGGFKWLQELGDDAYFARYDGREDLGNTEPGDGPRFHGRGFLQITGRFNYEKAGNALGLDLINDPDQAAKPDVGARIAAWYWRTRNLNYFADKNDFITITRRINGGLNGLEDRESYWEKAKLALAVA
jgi:predicted chitinase